MNITEKERQTPIVANVDVAVVGGGDLLFDGGIVLTY